MGLGRNLQFAVGALLLLAPLEAGALIVVRDLPAAECGESSAREREAASDLIPTNEQETEAEPCEPASEVAAADEDTSSLEGDRARWSPLDLIANTSLPESSPALGNRRGQSFEIPGQQELSVSPVVAVLAIPGADELEDRGTAASVRLAGQSGSLLDTAVPAALVFLVVIALGARIVHQRAG